MEIIEVKEFNDSYLFAVRKFLNQLVADPVRFTESDFKGIISAENSYLFLLTDKESVLGMLTVGVYKSPTGSKAWIEDVVIDEGARGKGYGRFIMEHAVSFVRSLGCTMLMLTSNPSRVAANKLYRSLGFERKETNVYRMCMEP